MNLTQTEPRTALRRVVTPRYSVKENETSFAVTVWVPGVDKTGVETTVDGDTLTVTGRRTWTAPESWRLVHREIPQADYRLVLKLDNRVNREGVQAVLTHGVLTLTVPKAEAIKPRRVAIKD